MVLRLTCLASVAAAAISAGSAAYAQQAPVAPPAPAPSSASAEDEDIVLQADTIEEDQNTGIVTASGNVDAAVARSPSTADGGGASFACCDHVCADLNFPDPLTLPNSFNRSLRAWGAKGVDSRSARSQMFGETRHQSAGSYCGFRAGRR